MNTVYKNEYECFIIQNMGHDDDPNVIYIEGDDHRYCLKKTGKLCKDCRFNIQNRDKFDKIRFSE